jgi:hypothetical protein
VSYNNQDARVYGDNNVVGHGNTITRNEIHNHNQSGGSGGGGGGDKNNNSNGEDGLGVAFALGSAIAISVWLFAKHSFEIYLYIKFAALLSAAPFVAALFVFLFGDADRKAGVLSTIVGASLGCAIFVLAVQSNNYLDPRIVGLSHQLGWKDFWATLPDYGKQLIIQNFLAAMLLAISCLLNFLMGIFVAWSAATNGNIRNSLVLYRLRAFRPKTNSFFLLVLLAVAWTLMTGRAFEFIKSLQMSML